MAISYEEALSTLQAMFPEWDQPTIAAVLDSNGRHMEHTIEAILAMGAGGGGQAGNQSSVAATSTTMRAPTPQMSSAAAAAPGPTRDSKYRGTRVNLPDNFLRVPGFQHANSYTIGDEQLAMMLQNEMFRQEVQQELGMMWPAGAQRSAGQRRSQQQAQQQQQSQQPQEEGSVMKAIQDMGDGLRRRMNELALRFRQRERLDEDESASRPLNRPSDDDEDDAEVITFDQNVQRRHRLNDDVDNYTSNPVATGGTKKDR